MSLAVHQVHISLANVSHSLDFMPPMKLIYTIAVVLSDCTRTCCLVMFLHRALSPSETACISKQLIWLPLSCWAHGPPDLLSAKTAPYPELEASVVITMELSGNIGLKAESILLIHQFSSVSAREDKVIGDSKFPLLFCNADILSCSRFR